MKSLKILLVEDNPGDVELTREALSASGRGTDLQVVEDGMKAIEYLERSTERSAGGVPDLVLLDLNLRGHDGRQVLQHIKSSDALKRVPVVVLTSSDAEDDVLGSYDLGANSYVLKPANLKAYRSAVQGVERFWAAVATLPPSGWN